MCFQVKKTWLDGLMEEPGQGRGRSSKGFDNEDERQWVCFDLVMKDLRIAVESG